jgi:hypothetical protein
MDLPRILWVDICPVLYVFKIFCTKRSPRFEFDLSAKATSVELIRKSMYEPYYRILGMNSLKVKIGIEFY